MNPAEDLKAVCDGAQPVDRPIYASPAMAPVWRRIAADYGIRVTIEEVKNEQGEMATN